MHFLRFGFVALIVPFALSACQNTYTATNPYSGNGFAQPIGSTKQIQTLISSNEASSLANSNTQASAPATPAAIQQLAKSSNAAAVKKTKEVAEATGPRRKLTAEQRMAANREMFHPIIAKHAKANGVPLKLALAVVEVESNYKPSAKGRAGEIGLMQLLPKTARYIGYEGKMQHLYHPDINILYGMKYLGKAYKLGGGTTCGTILKYNAGHAAKRMNKISRHYCKRVQNIMRQT